MLALELFIWWYSRGWLLLAKSVYRRFIRTSQMFSVPILIRTLFAPWRRIVSYPGAGVGNVFRAWIDNTVSRGVGFTVRILVLVAAAFALLAVATVSFVELVVWPLIPAGLVLALAKGILG